MNLMELFVKIGVDDQASSKLGGITSKIGGGLKTAADIGVKAVTAAFTAIIGLTGLAIKNYAEYEQLVGGVETLFKDSANIVKGYAENAYKTAGMSANDYMKNATSFSASLISALGGDTKKAAEYANTAMVSMSDNANKMGTDIESIVATYQSLARGNVAMLDNLKLGYGGTKAELERLIKDAASYTDVQKEMGLTVDESSMSFDNIVNAIAVVQGHLGIAGATAEEAATTIEGSVLSMKAAWSNLVTGIADDNADFGQLIDNFVESAGTAADNLIPRIEIALVGVGKLIEELFPVIMDRIPEIITNVLPSILKSAGKIVISIGNGILKNAGLLIETALNIILTLADGIATALPEMVPAIVDIILKIVDTLTDPNTLTSLVGAAFTIIIALADGIINALPELIKAVPKIIENIVSTIINMLPQIFNAGLELLKSFWNGIESWILTLLKNIGDMTANILKSLSDGLGTLISHGLEWIKSLWTGISNWATNLKNNVKKLASALPEKIKEGIGTLITIGKDWIQTLWNGISKWSDKLKENVETLGGNVLTKTKEGIGSLVSVGKNWIEGLWAGIGSKKDWLIEKITGLASNALDAIKDFFGIESPSTVMRDEVGKYMAEGIGVGFAENNPIDQIEAELNKGLKTLKPSLQIDGMATVGGTLSDGGGVSVVQNIYSKAQTAADLMQEAIYQQEKVVWLGV